MSSGAFQVPLDEELQTVAGTRVNARPSVVAERAAAIRYALDRVDELHCDGYTTSETPGIEAGIPVEVKSVRLTHNDGERIGRAGIHVGTHRELVERDGRYAIVLYVVVDVAGQERILVLAMAIVDVDAIDRRIHAGESDYQKVRWNLLLDAEEHGVDVDRWLDGREVADGS